VQVERGIRLLALTSGGIRNVELGDGVQVVRSGNVFVLEARGGSGAVVHHRVEHTQGVFEVEGLVTLFRSGLAMTEGEDYERTPDGAVLTKQGFDKGDVWSALCVL
jgi:hypothetical protein